MTGGLLALQLAQCQPSINDVCAGLQATRPGFCVPSVVVAFSSIWLTTLCIQTFGIPVLMLLMETPQWSAIYVPYKTWVMKRFSGRDYSILDQIENDVAKTEDAISAALTVLTVGIIFGPWVPFVLLFASIYCPVMLFTSNMVQALRVS